MSGIPNWPGCKPPRPAPARGFTLLESLVTMAVLGGLIVVVFAVFRVGATGFKVGTNRLDLQGDLRRLMAPLRKDLQNTSFQSTSFVSQSLSVPARPPNLNPTVTVQRDGLSMNGLLQPEDSDSYDKDSGLPIWDCYLCYFVTLDQPDGKLVRMVLKDPSRDVLSRPLNLGPGDLSSSNGNLIQNNLRVLSDQMMDFGVTLDQSNQLVRLHLRLRSKVGHQMMGGRSLVEILEIQTTINPANTNPRL